MATNWKSIVKSIIHKIIKRVDFGAMAGLILGIFSLFLLLAISFTYYTYYSVLDIWRTGIIANIFIVLACILELRAVMKRSFQKVSAEYTYQNWRHDFFRQQRNLILTELALFILIPLLFYFRDEYFYYYSDEKTYTSEYLMVFSALIFFLACEFTMIPIMLKRLNRMIEQTTLEHQNMVAAAVESEKRSIENAIKSEQLKVDLITNVSHDLKTPLTSMVGYIDLMKKEPLSDTMKDYVDVLSNKAQKLKEMIESLFSLAKASSGNIKLHPEPLNLNRMIEQIYADMEDQISSSQLKFVSELTASDTEIITDSSYLYRICQNLMENALKYSAANTRVFLKTRSFLQEEKRIIRFEITNTSGYPINFTKEQIVERFVRGDESRTSEGNGLGLAIVSTYTSALGGRFDVAIDCDQFRAIVEFEKTP